MKTKKNVDRKPNGLRTEDPQKTQRQKRVLVEGPMDLRQNIVRRQRQKSVLAKGPMDLG
jgi:hypothetical protein